MSLVNIELEEPRAVRPGDTLRGVAEWDLPGPPASVEIRAVWTARSAGGQEDGVAVSLPVERPQSRDRRAFELVAPDGPSSYHGDLFSISWCVEVRAEPGGHDARADVVIGPAAAPLVRLGG